MSTNTPTRFDRLVMPHLDGAYNLARWLIDNRDDAEDAVQEAMMRAYKYLDSCREDSARQWVLRIVRNTCYDWLAARNALATWGFADIDPEDADGAAYTADVFQDGTETPEGILCREDLRLEIDAMIAALPPTLREVIVLRELDELSYRDIAQVIGTPIGTVMSRLARARRLMIQHWNERHDT